MNTVSWMSKKYSDARLYYKEVVLTVPREDGIVLGAEEHLNILALLSPVALYVTEPEDKDIFVDGWLVSGTYLTHRHLEFGRITTKWTKGIVESQLKQGACAICDKKIPGEIQMMHHFYKLDN
jgi:hypothetical protein